MKSMDYIEEIKSQYCLSDEDVMDIVNYLQYIARDNGRYDADSFLEEVNDTIEEG